jgi:hypothetical protein
LNSVCGGIAFLSDHTTDGNVAGRGECYTAG